MRVENVHERTLPAPLDSVATLIDSLSSHDDLLWPRDRWPAMRFDRALSVGATGGHGPVRYFVESYVPGRSIRFRFTSPRVLDGFHGYEALASGPGITRLRHVLEIKLRGDGFLIWPLIFRPLHDALIEDSLDRAQRFCGEAREAASWSPWVRALRWAFRKARTRRSLALSAILLVSLSGRLPGQELQFAVGLTDHVVTAGPALEFARHLGAVTLEFGNDCGHQTPWCEVDAFDPAVESSFAASSSTWGLSGHDERNRR